MGLEETRKKESLGWRSSDPSPCLCTTQHRKHYSLVSSQEGINKHEREHAEHSKRMGARAALPQCELLALSPLLFCKLVRKLLCPSPSTLKPPLGQNGPE